MGNLEIERLPRATGLSFMTGLPDEVRTQLIQHGKVCNFSRGDLIQRRGDEGREFWYIEEGTVQIGRHSRAGKLTLFALLGAGECFGEQAFLGEFPRIVDAIAGTDCKLVRIGDRELTSLIAADPMVVRILLRAMARLVRQAFDLVEFTRQLSTRGRVAQALVRLCGRKTCCEIVITQQELADLVGASRVSLGKILTDLEKSGLISRNYGRIQIEDCDQLRQLSD